MKRGIERIFTWRSSTGNRFDITCPTLDALDLFFRDHPSFKVSNGGLVTSAIKLDSVDLGREKSIIVDVLRSAPFPALGRTELVRECLEGGMSSGTIGVYMTYAEILERIDDGVWAIRGAKIPASYVLNLKAEASVRRRSFEKNQVSGIGPSNRPWVALRLSESVCQSCVLHWNFHVDEIRGVDFTIIDAEDGEELGNSKVTNGFNYGYSAVFRKHSVKEGMTLRLTFFVDEGYVLAEFGSDELLSEPPDLG